MHHYLHKIRLATVCVITLATTFTFTAVANASTNVWDRVATCESGGNWAINTGNGFYGGLQFTHQTWQGYGGSAYAYNANGASRSAQITIAQRVLRGQGPGAWPVCSIQGGLTRGNGGMSTVSRSTVRRTLVQPRLLVVDGIRGPLTRAVMARHRIYFNTRPAIRAWQARLRVGRDGIAGPITTRAMQRWLNLH